MKKEEFISLLSKKLSGRILGKELELLEAEIRANEERRLLSGKLEGYLGGQKNLPAAKGPLEQIWEKINVSGNGSFNGKFDYAAPKRRSFAPNALLKAAAILVLCLGVGFLAYQVLNGNADRHFETAAAGNTKIFKLLDDGTRIWLNKKSTISYNAAFGRHRREIELEGEAYFDVARNREVPLVIHVGGIDIEVKGTAFNVNAYRGGAEIQVALLRGEIQVTDRLHGKNRVLLRPNEKLVFSAIRFPQNQNNFKVTPLTAKSLQKDINWAADTLTFRKEKLRDLVVRMEKKYDLKIEVKSGQLAEKRFSGTFTTETIVQALEALKLSYPLTYTISNRLVIIKD